MKIKYNPPLIIAHRGGRYWKGKNFSYICEAIAQGADMIELDIKQRKDKEYIVKHSYLSITQGTLKNALEKVKNIPIYLDIKDYSIDPNDLINFVRSKTKNLIIVGSFSQEILKKIDSKKKVIISYHIYSPWYDENLAKEIKADWIILWNYNVAKRKFKEINKQGMKIAPAGNLLYTKQAKYLKDGANAVFVYDVGKFKKAFKNLEETDKTKNSKTRQLIEKFKKKFQKNFKVIEKVDNTFKSHLPKIGAPIILTEDYIESLKELKDNFKSK